MSEPEQAGPSLVRPAAGRVAAPAAVVAENLARGIAAPPAGAVRRWIAARSSEGFVPDAGDDDDDVDDEIDDDDEPDGRGRRRRWLVHGISFEVETGGALGVVGSRDSGRPEVFRILGGLVPPTEGRAWIRGSTVVITDAAYKVTSTEMSVRRAAALIAKLFGPRRGLQPERWAAAAEFAGLSGRTHLRIRDLGPYEAKRLALATLLHLDADVLIIDDVLDDGGPEFAERCHHLVERRRRGGATLVLGGETVSAIARHCGEAITVERGRLAERTSAAVVDPTERGQEPRAPELVDALVTSSELELEIELALVVPVAPMDVRVALLFAGESGEALISQPDGWTADDPGQWIVRMTAPLSSLDGGTYRVDLQFLSADGDPVPGGSRSDIATFALAEQAQEGPVPLATEWPDEDDLAPQRGDETLAGVEWEVQRRA